MDTGKVRVRMGLAAKGTPVVRLLDHEGEMLVQWVCRMAQRGA